jgi:hypothetical protein
MAASQALEAPHLIFSRRRTGDPPMVQLSKSNLKCLAVAGAALLLAYVLGTSQTPGADPPCNQCDCIQTTYWHLDGATVANYHVISGVQVNNAMFLGSIWACNTPPRVPASSANLYSNTPYFLNCDDSGIRASGQTAASFAGGTLIQTNVSHYDCTKIAP